MRKIIVKVQKEKYEFFMQLLNSLDFVQVESDTGDSGEEMIENVKEVKRYKQVLNEPKTKYKVMEQEVTDIPAWQREEVKKRIEAFEIKPEQALGFDEAMDDIENYL